MLLFFSSVFFADVLIKDVSAVPVFQLASVLLTIQALESLSVNAFRIFGQIKRYSIIMLSKTFLEIGLISTFVLTGYDVVGVIFALIISESVFLLVNLLLIVSHAGFTFPDFSLLRPYLVFGLPIVPIGIFEVVTSSTDRYIIGYFHGASSVGIYSAAYGIGVFASMVGPFIIFILGPTIANLYDKKEIDAVKSHLSLSFKYYLMLAIPSAFGISILAKQLLSILTTQEFASISIYVIPLVASGVIFYGVYGMFGEAIKLSKRTYFITIAMGIAAILNVGLNIITVPYFGLIGAAFSTLLSYALAAGVLFYKSRQCIKFDIKLSFILKSILASGAMTLIIWIFKPVDILTVLISIVIGIIVYFFVLFILKGIEKQEVKTIVYAFGLGRLYEKIFSK